jgi:hypothetical protein
MNSETPSDWIQKLSALESVGAEDSVNKTAAWETLQARLHQLPRRRKTAWYWAAAVVLLAAGISFLLVSTDKALPPVAGSTTKNTEKIMVPGTAEAIDQIKTLPVRTPKKNRVQGIAKNNIITARLQALQPTDSIFIPAVQPPVLQAPVTATTLAAATASPKKILPVVHINELGMQEKASAGFATHRQHSFIQIQLLDQAPEAVPQQPTTVAGDQFIKTKISLKN